MKTFKEYIDIKSLSESYEQYGFGRLDESGAGMSRVLQKLEDGRDFIFISASRGEYSKKENHKRNNELLQFFNKKLNIKLGAYKMIGHWKECSTSLKAGEKIGDCKGKITNNLEESWFIIKPDEVEFDVFDSLAQEACDIEKYDQDSYIIRDNGKVLLKGKDGTTWENLGKASHKSLTAGFAKIIDIQGYSELAKRRKHGAIQNIVFENIYVVVPKDNNSSKMLFGTAGIKF